MDNLSKSNRAQADYFELLVGQHICHLYNVSFSFSKDLAELSNKVLAKSDGAERLKLQNDNLIKIAPEIKKILDYEITEKGKVIKVIWTGRDLIIQSTSDIEAEHLSSKRTKFSIKSIESGGSGTMKNLGLRRLQLIFGFSFVEQNRDMWGRIRVHLNDNISSKAKLKAKIRSDKVLLDWSQENGKEFQKELNNLCFNGFNNLSTRDKIMFLDFVTDNSDSDLYVIIVNSKGVVVYKPITKQTKLTDIICAKDKTETGYTIYINEVATYRVQTNNTNGIGVSPFCQRIFLI